MSDIGHKSRETIDAPKAKRGRPKKDPELVLKEKEKERKNRDQKIRELLDKAVELFRIPYDDRDDRPPDAPTISFVAEEMNTTRLRVRKLLITADFYSSATSREIAELHKGGADIREICEKTGLERATVHSYLPFQRVVYKMDSPSLNAKQCKQFHRRKKACEQLKEHLAEDTCGEKQLWEAIQAFDQYHFRTEDGRELQYNVDLDCENICFGYLTLCRGEIEKAFHKARQIQAESGCVCDPGRLACKGAEELYTIFLRIGACCKSNQNF